MTNPANLSRQDYHERDYHFCLHSHSLTLGHLFEVSDVTDFKLPQLKTLEFLKSKKDVMFIHQSFTPNKQVDSTISSIKSESLSVAEE